MTTVTELISRPRLRKISQFLGGDLHAGPVRSVTVVEALSAVPEEAEGTLVVCTELASRQASSYQIDLAIRRWSSLGVCAIALVRDSTEPLSPIIPRLAERAGMALLAIPVQVGISPFLAAVGQELTTSLSQMAGRVASLLVELDQWKATSGTDIVEWATRASDAIGATVHTGLPPRASPSAPVVVDGVIETHFWVEPDAIQIDAVLQLLLEALARRASDRLMTSRGLAGPARPLGGILAELIMRPDGQTETLIAEAETLGFHVSGYHIAVRLQVEAPGIQSPGASDVATIGSLVAGLARRQLSHERGSWYEVPSAGTLSLVWNSRDEPAPSTYREMRTNLKGLIDAISHQLDTTAIWCGVGGLRDGSNGLVASAAEARAAVTAARAAGKARQPVFYDSLGLRKMVMDWYGQPGIREALTRLLAPLDSLGERRRSSLLSTLQAVFKHQGNISGAAAELGIHRNTVGLRLRTAFDLLDLDYRDPDHRLMLELATRIAST